jgi:hypothetical protein
MKPLPSSPGVRRRIRDNAVLYVAVLILCVLSCLAGISMMTATAIGVCTVAFK